MIVEGPIDRCGECGSTNTERFQRPSGDSGIRCLSCGHTKMISQQTSLEDLLREGHIPRAYVASSEPHRYF